MRKFFSISYIGHKLSRRNVYHTYSYWTSLEKALHHHFLPHPQDQVCWQMKWHQMSFGSGNTKGVGFQYRHSLNNLGLEIFSVTKCGKWWSTRCQNYVFFKIHSLLMKDLQWYNQNNPQFQQLQDLSVRYIEKTNTLSTTANNT